MGGEGKIGFRDSKPLGVIQCVTVEGPGRGTGVEGSFTLYNSHSTSPKPKTKQKTIHR